MLCRFEDVACRSLHKLDLQFLERLDGSPVSAAELPHTSRAHSDAPEAIREEDAETIGIADVVGFEDNGFREDNATHTFRDEVAVRNMFPTARTRRREES